MGIVRRHKEENDRYRQEKLLGRCILIAIVNLFPHIEVVIGSSVEIERHAAYPMEHDIATSHVGDVCKCPGGFLCDAGDNVVEDLEADDEDEMNCPSSCSHYS